MQLNKQRFSHLLSRLSDYHVRSVILHNCANISTLHSLLCIACVRAKMMFFLLEVDHMNDFNLKFANDIAVNTGIDWITYLEIVKAPDKQYSSFFIKKKNGGFRHISSPSTELYTLQLFIKKNILDKIPIHKSAFGFVNGKSILDNVELHQNSDCVMNLDLKDFFPSINKKRLYHVFLKICNFDLKIANNLVELCSLFDGLPQGAPTSPILSNIVSYGMDNAINKYTEKLGLKYSRYADDITISGKENLINEKLFYNIKKIIERNGFTVNNKKTRFGNLNKGIVITGLRVYKDKVCVPRSYIRKINTELRFIEKYGLENHKNYMKITNSHYLEHILGKIKYVKYIEENQGDLLLSEFRRIFDNQNHNLSNSSVFDLLGLKKID